MLHAAQQLKVRGQKGYKLALFFGALPISEQRRHTASA